MRNAGFDDQIRFYFLDQLLHGTDIIWELNSWTT